MLYFQRKLNYINVDDSISFHISFEKISIYFKYRYIAQPYIGPGFVVSFVRFGKITSTVKLFSQKQIILKTVYVAVIFRENSHAYWCLLILMPSHEAQCQSL